MPVKSNIILFDDNFRDNLLPLTFTRPVAELRVGITTLKQKWERISETMCSYHTQPYLASKYPEILRKNNLFINGGIIPDDQIAKHIFALKEGQVLKNDDTLIAYYGNSYQDPSQLLEAGKNAVHYPESFLHIKHPWDIFTYNEKVIHDDFRRLTAGRKSQNLSNTNKILGREYIFVEEGASLEYATINATTGPVYIGSDVEIMEGAVIRGPLAMCDHSVLKMGAKVYGATTLGPYCKVGGEVHNSVFTGYSNKAHDGYLGDAVIGEWCNLGADTNNSNLKNNYAKVKVWDYSRNRFVNTGLQFCGLIMGDHSKCAINTMFNTGTVVGVSANIFGAGFPRNFIPSFSWGGSAGYIVYKINKALETAEIVMARRNIELSDADRQILTHVYQVTENYRKYWSA